MDILVTIQVVVLKFPMCDLDILLEESIFDLGLGFCFMLKNG